MGSISGGVTCHTRICMVGAYHLSVIHLYTQCTPALVTLGGAVPSVDRGVAIHRRANWSCDNVFLKQKSLIPRVTLNHLQPSRGVSYLLCNHTVRFTVTVSHAEFKKRPLVFLFVNLSSTSV